MLGLATIADDVSAELALATIASVEVLGAFRAPRAVKAALGAAHHLNGRTARPTGRRRARITPKGFLMDDNRFPACPKRCG